MIFWLLFLNSSFFFNDTNLFFSRHPIFDIPLNFISSPEGTLLLSLFLLSYPQKKKLRLFHLLLLLSPSSSVFEMNPTSSFRHRSSPPRATMGPTSSSIPTSSPRAVVSLARKRELESDGSVLFKPLVPLHSSGGVGGGSPFLTKAKTNHNPISSSSTGGGGGGGVQTVITASTNSSVVSPSTETGLDPLQNYSNGKQQCSSSSSTEPQTQQQQLQRLHGQQSSTTISISRFRELQQQHSGSSSSGVAPPPPSSSSRPLRPSLPIKWQYGWRWNCVKGLYLGVGLAFVAKLAYTMFFQLSDEEIDRKAAKYTYVRNDQGTVVDVAYKPLLDAGIRARRRTARLMEEDEE